MASQAPAAGYVPQPMRLTVNQRIRYGYHKWGFVIYRCTYDDDALWEAFVTMLKASAAAYLQARKQENILGPDLQWTIIEDRATLDGASKETVRQHFLDWVAAHSVERDGEGIDNPSVPQLPRFRYCVYVDADCLNAIRAWWCSVRPAGYRLRGEVVVIQAAPETPDGSLDSEEEDDEDDEDVYDAVEGCTADNVGWMYYAADGLLELYEELAWTGSHTETWRLVYERPGPDGPREERGENPVSADLSQQVR
ncbi:hypothetical protein MAPG_06067 [Magnaporthiopsis poae ATCC 64411]|uniref:Uncharacterized protein n=1 Tax=Magnaporthiopsis poae (strain ATCC 64411 / 73-15) TaxID=644358 RepID=A0A0C4E124_MAGP6|nr:hypothetical protein MAPG_06067 [Magnaporthiopsis poae ATCC 64411]